MQREFNYEVWAKRGTYQEEKLAAFKNFDQAERFVITFLQKKNLEIVCRYDEEEGE